ncbi:MAG: HAMP domain-containing sensor histidine kinase [Spirosomataceae bacterium]
MQIRTRLTIQFTLLVTAILLVSFLIIYFYTYLYIEDRFFQRLKNRAVTTAELFLKVDEVDLSLLKTIDRRNRDVLYKENITIYNYEDEKIYTSNDSIGFLTTHQLLEEIRQTDEKRFHQGEFAMIGLRYGNKEKGFVILAGASDAYGEYILNTLRDIMLFILIGVVGIVAILGRMFSRRALQPISDVIEQVNRIVPSSLDRRLIESKYEDEIGKLIQTFNNLLGRIENAFRLQKTFVANVSHELKNPLTKISSQLEVSLMNERQPEAYRRTLASVLEDVQELSQLSNSLLELAKITADKPDVLFDDVRIDDVLWNARDTLTQVKQGYQVQLELDNLPEDEAQLCVKGNEALLGTAFRNLMENACKFSPDRTVRVRFTPAPKEMTLIFSNGGEGIPNEQLPYIFQPFYRGNNANLIRGYGIGLSLVERIIKLHLGKIKVDSVPNKSTIFTVVLPVG